MKNAKKYLYQKGDIMKDEITINFDSLLKQGFAIIDARFKNYSVTKDGHKYIIIQITSDRDTFYKDMLKNLTSREVEAKDVMTTWTNILEHKLDMSKLLDRDISIRVAALDYFE